ncbi:helix-turn-helix domain-containing protein [Treponema sp.]|uniref:helix-turn-helix domain-containing protein n=1 Tax=Treponema sp. TaxID=166 RepID=UPI003FD875A6
MEANYKKLWKLLIDKDLKRTELINLAGITSNIIAKMGKGELVSMESLKKICNALDCDVGDIVELNDKMEEKSGYQYGTNNREIYKVPIKLYR